MPHPPHPIPTHTHAHTHTSPTTQSTPCNHSAVPQWTGYKNHVVLAADDKAVRAFAETGWNSVVIWCYMSLEQAAAIAARPVPSGASSAEEAAEDLSEEVPKKKKNKAKKKSSATKKMGGNKKKKGGKSL